MALNSSLLFLLSSVLVLGTVVATYSEERWDAELSQRESAVISSGERRRCPAKEEYSECHAHCQRNCSNVNELPSYCLLSETQCVSGCVCIPGLVRASNGKCVLPRECSVASDKCPPGEHFDQCGYYCQRNCSNWSDPTVICPLVCMSGCVCDEGTIRETTPNGRCIEPRKCLPRDSEESSETLVSVSEEEEEGVGIAAQGDTFCPPQEVFVACYGHCEKDCSTKDSPSVPCRRVCVSECRCKYGMVRGPRGTCVKPEQCPDRDPTKYPVKRVCPRNEHWETSTAHCQKNCTNLHRPLPCPKIQVAGCVCDKGLYRGKDGKCIPRDQCPKRAEMAEEISAEESLSEIEDASEEIEDLVDIHAENVQSGHSFCPPNEFFVPCYGICEKDCGSKNTSVSCPRFCVSECRCTYGFVRGPDGTCVRPDKCPKDDITKYPVVRKCPKDERWETATAHCQKNCTNMHKALPCLAIAIPGCVCKKGLYRGKDGKCIPRNQCPKRSDAAEEWEQGEDASSEIAEMDLSKKRERFCPENEEFSRCKGHCERDCGRVNTRVPCARVCVPECKCKRGYVRGPEGTCVVPGKCPDNDTTRYPVQRVCPKNEHWDVASAHCQKTCKNKDEVIPCLHIAVAGCVCDKGMYRRRDGKCVLEDQCIRKKEDMAEEIDYSFDYTSVEEEEEIISSEIEDASEEAVQTFCPPNELFVACYGHCEQDCSTKNTSYVPCRRVCVSECKCKYGYVRGPKGTCVLPEKCPKKDTTKYPVKRVCPKNERWEASTAHCQKNCTNMHKPIPCPQVSVSGCVCTKGLYRGKDGKCIPRNECPKKPLSSSAEEGVEETENENVSEEFVVGANFCPANEFFVACYGHCEKDCSTRNSSVVQCPRGVCVSECRCLWGFVRGPRGTCVTPANCPKNDTVKYPVKRVCPRHEHWDASTAHCQKNCTTLDKTIPCTRIKVAGCVCNKGLYRGKDGKCIPRDQCPKKMSSIAEEIASEESENLGASAESAKGRSFCPPNQMFSACVGHCEKDCKTKDTTVISCRRDICVSECKCLWGWVRGPKGTCIKPEKCPKDDNTEYPVKRLCPRKEHWDPTTAHCQKNCTNMYKPVPCLKIAVGGCVCDKGLFRAKDGKCVPRIECPKGAEEEDIDEELIDEDDMLSEKEQISAEIESNEEIELQSGGCPNERACSEFCRRNHRRFGRCIGRHNLFCKCR